MTDFYGEASASFGLCCLCGLVGVQIAVGSYYVIKVGKLLPDYTASQAGVLIFSILRAAQVYFASHFSPGHASPQVFKLHFFYIRWISWMGDRFISAPPPEQNNRTPK